MLVRLSYLFLHNNHTKHPGIFRTKVKEKRQSYSQLRPERGKACGYSAGPGRRAQGTKLGIHSRESGTVSMAEEGSSFSFYKFVYVLIYLMITQVKLSYVLLAVFSPKIQIKPRSSLNTLLCPPIHP